MENSNEVNSYEIYSKTMDKLNIAVANIDPTDIDNIIGRLESVTAIDLDKFAGEALFTLNGIVRDARIILDMAYELRSDSHGETQYFGTPSNFSMYLKVLKFAVIGFREVVSDRWKTICHPLFDPDPYIPHVPKQDNLDNIPIPNDIDIKPPYPFESPFYCRVGNYIKDLLHS